MQLMTFCKIFKKYRDIPDYIDDKWLMTVTGFCREFNYDLHDVDISTVKLDKKVLVTAVYKVRKITHTLRHS